MTCREALGGAERLLLVGQRGLCFPIQMAIDCRFIYSHTMRTLLAHACVGFRGFFLHSIFPYLHFIFLYLSPLESIFPYLFIWGIASSRLSFIDFLRGFFLFIILPYLCFLKIGFLRLSLNHSP
jgi:hypothetical protein